MLNLFKNAYGGITRQVWLLSLVMLINRAGTMVIAFLTLYLTKELGFTTSQAGYVLMSWGFGAVLGAWLGGKLTDLYGFYIVQFLSLLLGGLVFFVLNELRDIYSLCICTFILSTFGEAYRPANTASIAHFSTPETFTRSVSLVRLAINLGWAIGPFLGGFLATYNYSWLFWVDAFTNIGAAVIVWIFLRTKIEKRAELTPEQKSLNRSESAYRDKIFMIFIVFATCYGMTFFPLFTVFTKFYEKVCRFSEIEIGTLLGINGLLVVLVEMVLIYKIQNKLSKLQFMALGASLLVLNYIVFLNFTSFAWMLVGICLATASEIFAMPFMSAFSMERAKSYNRGQYSGAYMMTWSVAQVASPLVGTQVISNYGFDVLWYIFGGIALVATLGFWWLDSMVQ